MLDARDGLRVTPAPAPERPARNPPDAIGGTARTLTRRAPNDLGSAALGRVRALRPLNVAGPVSAASDCWAAIDWVGYRPLHHPRRDVSHLTGADAPQNLDNARHEWSCVGEAIASCAQNDDAERECADVLLVLNASIHRDQRTIPSLRRPAQECPIPDATPAEPEHGGYVERFGK
jgi:hypothetical protein